MPDRLPILLVTRCTPRLAPMRAAASTSAHITGRQNNAPSRTDSLGELPEDVLWKILGFLDLPTLYTARLVCKRLRTSAAGHFRALDCTTLKEVPTTDFRQFSGTTYLAVTVSQKSQLQSLAHPRLAPVVTHVSLKGFRLRDRQTAGKLEDVLVRLPKLRSVSLQPLGGGSRVPLFPSRLEELKIRAHQHDHQWKGVRNNFRFTRYSQLTSLDIEVGLSAGTSMGSLSSFRNLRSLHLCGCSSWLGLLSTLPALTSLTFMRKYSGEDRSVFQHIGRLTGLLQLALPHKSLTQEDLTCIAQLSNMTSLDLSGCRFDDSAAQSTALAPLTRLLSVNFSDSWMGDGILRLSRLLSRLQMESLESLNALNVSEVSVLQRATRLTHLKTSHCLLGNPQITRGLCPALASMSRLRCLEIFLFSLDGDEGDCSDPEQLFQLDRVLRACTMLTKLDYRFGPLRPGTDLRACAALPGLRSLSLWGPWENAYARPPPRLTPANLPALQAMSGLTDLSLVDTGICGWHITTDVLAGFDARRRQLGWPLLKLRIKDTHGRRFERLEQ